MSGIMLFGGCIVNWGSVADIATAIIAFGALIISVCEYNKHKKRERVKILAQMNIRYTTDSDINSVIKYLEALEDDENTSLDSPTIHQLEMFMHFIEELQLLIKGGSVSKSAALNLFGHYTTVLDKYQSKWPELGYDEKYWNVYREFVDKAKNFDYKYITV